MVWLEGAVDGEAEERRLFYVAATRAKDELYLCHPLFHVERDHTRTILRPSRFVSEITPIGPDAAPLFDEWIINEVPTAEVPALESKSRETVAPEVPALPAVDPPKKPELPLFRGR